MSASQDLVVIDADFDDALPIEPARAAQYLFYAIAGLFFCTIVWASLAKLDRVTRGEGRVVTSNQLQELQYLEGGIVKEILVHAGDEVSAGQLLIRLDPTQMNVEYQQGQDGYNLLAARISRLEAEAALKPLIMASSLVRGAPHIVSSERELYDARMAELNAAIDIELNKLDQRRQALADARVSFETAKEGLNYAAQELSMMRTLVSKGIEPRVELLRAKQRESALRGDMQRAEIAVSQAELEVGEAEGEIARVRKTFAAAAADDLTKARAEMDSLKGELPALRDKVSRTEVRAPIAGVINRVLVSTIGGVVGPGETIVEIVPSDDTLLIEARIKPSDIGFLSIGQDAKVSITAFDSSVYGSLEGVIERISPDAIEDERSGERYYEINVRTSAETLSSDHGELRILPGMAADVAVLNGKRSVFAYLMKPLVEVGDKALKDK